MERFLSVCACVTNFQSKTYLSCFKTEFEAVKGKLGLLIKKIKISIPPTGVCSPFSVCPPFLLSQEFQVKVSVCLCVRHQFPKQDISQLFQDGI